MAITLFCGALWALSCYKMRLNISFPAPTCQILTEVKDEHKPHTFPEKLMGTEVAAEALGEDGKGYVVQISGRNDKQVSP